MFKIFKDKCFGFIHRFTFKVVFAFQLSRFVTFVFTRFFVLFRKVKVIY